jgi:hypothetical protein
MGHVHSVESQEVVMEHGTGDPIALNGEIHAHRQSLHEHAAILKRLELKVDALCQLLRDKGAITRDDYKRLTLWGTDGTR